MISERRFPRGLLAVLFGLTLLPGSFARAQEEKGAGAGQGDGSAKLEGSLTLDVKDPGVEPREWFALEIVQDETGVTLAKVDETLRAHLALPEDQGAVVTAVAPDSRMAKAGVEPKDILLKVDETALGGGLSLRQALDGRRGKPVTLRLLRAGKPKELALPPEKASEELATFRFVEQDSNALWIGIRVARADDTLRSHLNLPDSQGLVATEILPDSPASAAGLKVNDILLKMDDKPLGTAKDLQARIQATGEKTVPIEIIRGGKPIIIRLAPARRQANVAVVGEDHLKKTHPERFSRIQGKDTVFAWVRPGVVVEPVNKDVKNLVWKWSTDKNAWVFPGETKPAAQPPSGIEARLDELVDQVKHLREAVEALRTAKKSE